MQKRSSEAIAQRLNYLSRTRVFGLAELCVLTAIPVQRLKTAFEGKGLSTSDARALCNRLNINMDWLLEGRGRMFASRFSDEQLRATHIHIPVLTIEHGVVSVARQQRLVCPEYMADIPLASLATIALVSIQAPTLDPYLMVGDVVLVDKSPIIERFIPVSSPVVFNFDGQFTPYHCYPNSVGGVTLRQRSGAVEGPSFAANQMDEMFSHAVGIIKIRLDLPS